MQASTPLSPARRRALCRLAALGGAGWLAGLPSARAGDPTPAAAWSVQTLRAFDVADGTRAVGELVFGPDGRLYGVHAMGGAQGLGTVFRWTPDDGSFTVIHDFAYAANDGFEPEGGLVVGRDGRLWGTTLGGGQAFAGTVFSIATDGSEAVEASFGLTDAGTSPLAGLVEGRPGHFFGTTSTTVYRFDPRNGKLRLLHAFDQGSDGFGAQSCLVRGRHGDLFGVNPLGGPGDHGTVFRLAADGSDFQVVKVFHGRDGAQPDARLLLASDGALYGTTSHGGDFDRGVVFRVGRDGSDTVLHHFAGGRHDGAYPRAGLVEGPDGALYGSTVEGGHAPQSWGTVYRITRRGRFSLLHRFGASGAEGGTPVGAMVFGADGCLYGTGQSGAAHNLGALFRLRPPAA